MIWSLVQRLGKNGINMLCMLWLATLLSPTDFGILYTGIVWIGLVRIFIDLGFPLAMIRMKDLNEYHASSFFYFNLASSVVTYICYLLSVYLIVPENTENNYRLLFSVIGLTLVIETISNTHRILAQRDLKFKTLAKRDIVATLLSAGVAITAAHHGLGVWSLALQSVTMSAASSLLLLMMSNWSPNRNFVATRSLRQLWDHSKSFSVAEILKYTTQNYHLLAVSYVFDAATTGLFAFSWKFSITIFREPIKAVESYLFPLFSRKQDKKRVIAAVYISVLQFISHISFPIMLILATLIPYLIENIYEQQWSASATSIPILMLTSFSYIYITISNGVKKSLGKVKWIIAWTVGFSLGMIIIIFIGKFIQFESMLVLMCIFHYIASVVIFISVSINLDIKLNLITVKILPLLFLQIITLVPYIYIYQNFTEDTERFLILFIAIISYIFISFKIDFRLNKQIFRWFVNLIR